MNPYRLPQLVSMNYKPGGLDTLVEESEGQKGQSHLIVDRRSFLNPPAM
jgi:hypothetical protein